MVRKLSCNVIAHWMWRYLGTTHASKHPGWRSSAKRFQCCWCSISIDHTDIDAPVNTDAYAVVHTHVDSDVDAKVHTHVDADGGVGVGVDADSDADAQTVECWSNWVPMPMLLHLSLMMFHIWVWWCSAGGETGGILCGSQVLPFKVMFKIGM